MGMTEAEFLAQYQLPDEERRRLLLGNALLGLGSGLMQSKRGGELTNAGLGLFAGAQQGQNAIADAQRGQVDKFKLKQMWQESEDKKAQQAAMAALSQRLTNAGNPTSGMPSLSPTNENVASVPKSYEIAMRQWQIATDAGDLRRAEEYRKAAEFLRVKYGLTPQTVMRGDKPVIGQMSETGDFKELQGYAPKPDYQKVDTGKETLFYDPLTGGKGGSFAMQTTPGQDQSAALQRAQMAQAERHFQANQGGEQFGTPIQITTPDGGTQLYAPRKGTNQVVPMTDANGNPVTKSASIPQAYKDKSYTLANLRDSVDDYSKTLATMTGADAFKPAKIAELEAKYGAVQMGAKNLFELGALAGPDIKILEQNLTNPTSFRGMGMRMAGGGLEAQNKVIKEMIDRNERNLATAYNQRPRTYKPTNSPAANMSDDELRRQLGL